jgi:(2S)-methylsuccinyl-CoA dehydrogenase
MAEGQQHLDWMNEKLDLGLSFIKSQVTIDGKIDGQSENQYQQAIYDLAVSKAEIECAQAFLANAASGTAFDESMASTFAAQMIQQVSSRLGSSDDFGLAHETIRLSEGTRLFCSRLLSHSNLAGLGEQLIERQGDLGKRGLEPEKQLMADTFRQFAEEVVGPLAEQIHRQDLIIPDAILDGLTELGCFGLSVPEQYGGLLPDDREDSLGMIVVTEELSRVSLGGAGSLINRAEILSRALLEGGTLEQKQHWLPRIASGDALCAVAITEPDFGSDVASVKLKATMTEAGWLLNGEKTWCTFAGKAHVLLTLARTEPDTALGHRGLSLFLVEKPSTGHNEFEVVQSQGGELSGKAISTIGYRGMHSYQLFFKDYLVPHSHVIGEGQGLGKGFYFTMRGFTGGRIQTAARACGVMQGAFDQALSYACDRKVFAEPIADFPLSKIKLVKMAMAVAAGRQFTYAVGRLMDQGKGQMQASLVKLMTCKSAEWVTRQAMQLHGGMGYAEEVAVSRYWLDARVLSIFEGTEETLALKVVGRRLVEQAR